MNWREYHELTSHSAESLRRTQRILDWANMPEPFRHYEGVPVLDLPADPPAPEIPALAVLQGEQGTRAAREGPAFLSQLLFYSAATSASKLVPSMGYRYALRVNPSSGNLHPTEFHFLTRGLAQWPDGLYHYRPSSHMAEQRAIGRFDVGVAGGDAPIVFILTSIAWREAWKYRDRAYRYCLLDMGHAWQSLAFAARAIGCDSCAVGHFPDDEVAERCRFHGDEWPMLIVRLSGGSIPVRDPDARETAWFGGEANRLSRHEVAYPRIEAIHAATKLKDSGTIAGAGLAAAGLGEIRLGAPASSTGSFGEVARARRSALDFRGGPEWMSLEQLSAIVAVTRQPLSSDFGDGRFIQLYLYVHRVQGLAPGVYRYWPEDPLHNCRGSVSSDKFEAALPIRACEQPEHGKLESIRPGDQRVAAAGLSLGQDLAGNACVAFSMVGDLDRAVRAHGDRGYRYVHFEAGALGQRLYLAAEALGLRATGIGAFFDHKVHRYLNLDSERKVVYHFAIGYPVPDPRLDE